jgi:type I restriction enzyme S subunit
LSEQRELTTALEAARLQTNRMVSKIERQVDMLREHRQALITAAVTGQFDGAEAAA